jgi:hypothetical protein
VRIDVRTGAPEPVREFLTEDADPGWSVTGEWAFGQPSGGGSHDGDPTSGATGSNVFGYNLDGDYTDDMGEEFLTSVPVDLTNITGATLEFQRWLAVEGSVHDHAAVRVSTDGVNWTTVWNHLGPAVSDSSWSLQSIDVSALADGEDSVRFRWVMGSTDGAVTYPGWNVDDIRVVGVVQATCSRLPGEVSNLKFAADKQTLEWSLPPALGEAPPVYDIIRSTLPSDFVSGAVCVSTDDETTSTTDTDVPPPGTLFYYLVRAENDCGASPLGVDRLARLCAP